MRKTENREILERLTLARERLAQIPGEQTVPEPFRDFFGRTASFLLSVRRDAVNRSLYEDILPENYGSSWCNPDYARQRLGDEYGPLLSAAAAELRGMIPAVFEEDGESEAVLLEFFLELYFEFEREEPPAPGTVRRLIGMYLRDYASFFAKRALEDQLCPGNSFAAEIIRGADFSSTDYLYRYGEYVAEDTLRTARFINSLPEETVRKMADTCTEGFRLGFVRSGKDLKIKKTVQIVYELGYERMVAMMMENFASMGLLPTFVRSPVRMAGRTGNRKAGYTGAVPNWQFDYDHREDLALVLDESYVSLRRRAYRDAFEALKYEAGVHAGPAVVETFGEKPFVPRECRYAIRMDADTSKLMTEMRTALLMIRGRYIPDEERSFMIIDFPVPAVGPDFEAIFRDTIEVNTLDQDLYRDVQQKLIDVLDGGVCVHITGARGNETDLTIALHPLEDPERQTNFENCLADVNIPLGEVFTTPALRGTGGLLHVSRVFLNGYEFRDLRITVKNGMTAEYSCGNYEDAERGRRYIEENILFHHPSLPVGEFAIGTNTTAYAMAARYQIESRLPILIAEKTGPHFALGDTCYSMEEDRRVYNPDGKEIVAKDNEHTILRRSDPSAAYYGCHTDITLPYSELGRIAVIGSDGAETDILRDGRFVLPGTEVLNSPLGGER